MQRRTQSRNKDQSFKLNTSTFVKASFHCLAFLVSLWAGENVLMGGSCLRSIIWDHRRASFDAHKPSARWAEKLSLTPSLLMKRLKLREASNFA